VRINELILEDHHRTIDDLVHLSGESWSSYQRILSEEMQMKRVVASPQQRGSAQRLECETIFNQKQHDPASPPTIFTRSRSVRLLFIPLNEKRSKRKTFCGRGKGEEKNNGGIKRHHFARISGLLRKAENTFRPVHCIKLTVFRRRFNL